jgi:hypothetical protein
MMREKSLAVYIVVCLFIFAVLFGSFGVALADQWVKTYGGTGEDKASSVQQTEDGGYIVIGSTSSYGAGDQDIWILKLDISGNVEWQKTFGGSGVDEASAVLQTAEGGFIIAGRTSSFGAGKNDAWILKLDRDGNVQWQKTFGGAEDDEAYSVQQTSDNGYIVAGSTASFGVEKKDAWILKLDADGRIEWQKTFGGSEDDSAHDVQQLSDGSYIFAGTTASFGAGKKDVWVVKLGIDGKPEWQKTYGTKEDEEAYLIRQASDEGFLIGGWTKTYGDVDAWIIKIDSVGIVKWQKAYGADKEDRIYSVRQTGDGKYIAAGSTDSFGAGKKDAWILRLDGNGNILWQKIFGGNGDDEAVSAEPTLDGGFILAGWTSSYGAGSGDVWGMKLDSNGNVPDCQLFGVSFTSSSNTYVSGVGVDATVKDADASTTDSSGSSGNTEVVPNPLCAVPNPDIYVDPDSVSFGSVTMGASATDTVTVTNMGSEDLVMKDLGFLGSNTLDFAIREDNCSGKTLKAQESCSTEIIFSPLSKGTRSAYLSIPSNDSDFENFYVPLSGEGTHPINLSSPANQTSFSACSLYELPIFSWTAGGSFKSYDVQFSKTQAFNPVSIKVKSSTIETAIKLNNWKQVLSIPGATGGPVFWRVMGTYSGGKTAFVSDYRSFNVEPNQPVKDNRIEPAGRASLPVLSWENVCNLKFKVSFGKDESFLKKSSISFTIKNPKTNEGKFSQTLTERQWGSIRKLVNDEAGSTLYWKVESWDGMNRLSQTAVKNFLLEE